MSGISSYCKLICVSASAYFVQLDRAHVE